MKFSIAIVLVLSISVNSQIQKNFPDPEIPTQSFDEMIANNFPNSTDSPDNAGCQSPKKCTPYYHCKVKRSITPRFSGCEEIVEICCPEDKITKENIPPPIFTRPIRCGVRNDLTVVDFKLSANDQHLAEFGEFPWVLALLEQNTDRYLGGASLIHPQVAITALHSILSETEKDIAIKVRAGEWNMQSDQEYFKHQERNVREKIMHQEFEIVSLSNDFALLVLDKPFQLAPHINTICLPSQHFLTRNKTCISNGWGKNTMAKTDKFSDILKKIPLPIIPHSQCQRTLRSLTDLGNNFELDHSFICAGGERGVDTCTGDGGSPLSCKGENNQHYLAGIVSWGIDCKQALPAAYANVAVARDWIDKKMDILGFDKFTYQMD